MWLRKEYIADVKGSLVGSWRYHHRPAGRHPGKRCRKRRNNRRGTAWTNQQCPFYGCVYRTYRRNERPMIHSSRIRGMPTVKLRCFVLWRNSCIPAMAPTPPPKKAERNSVRSGIRQRPQFGLPLVNAHQEKGQYIDEKQVVIQILHRTSLRGYCSRFPGRLQGEKPHGPEK